MREILFRGKTSKKSPFVYGNLHIVAYGGKKPQYEIWQLGNKTHNCFTVLENSIGQFTGLTDKNGNKIFEGDILKWDCREWGGEFNEVVRWDYEQLNMRKRDWKDWCEVIGNIYDNPELLNKD